MYLVDKKNELEQEVISKIVDKFLTSDVPKLNRYYNYYNGKHDILNKKPRDKGRPCNKVMTNYCHSIVQTFNGYLTGVDIAYTGNNLNEIQKVLNYNDCHSVDNELLKNALIAGVSYEIAYLDEYGEERFKVLDPRTVIPIYDNTLNQELRYVIRLYRDENVLDDEFYVEVYDAYEVKTYKSNTGFKSFNLIDQKPHFFKQVPITVFELNSDRESIFSQIISLQDAYNTLQSGELDSWDAFADAYLIMKGVMANADELEDAKESRVFMIDNDSEIKYLTKNINDTQIQNMLVDINNNIHKIANCPDFSQESFGTASGIALRFRLINFENVASNIEANMKKALQKRIELLCEIVNLKGGESVWRDVNIQFTRNLPINVEEITNTVNSLRGLVSDETLLSLLPFIDSPAEEIKKLKAQQQANISMYQFPTGDETDE